MGKLQFDMLNRLFFVWLTPHSIKYAMTAITFSAHCTGFLKKRFAINYSTIVNRPVTRLGDSFIITSFQ